MSVQTGLIRKPELKQKIGLSESTIWRLEKSGQFPKRKQITSRLVGWLRSDVDKWIESREAVA